MPPERKRQKRKSHEPERRRRAVNADCMVVNTDSAAAAQSSDAPVDNFFSPANYDFYRSQPYSDLDHPKHEIRLLELLPIKDGMPLQVKLLGSFFLSCPNCEPPAYRAISYCAGNPKDTEVVIVNGLPFNAFANLAKALKQVILTIQRRDIPRRPRYIWADQICINQSSPTERSHQVGFMRKIYESAETVLASLGWEDPTEGRCVIAVKRLQVASAVDIRLEGSKVLIKDQVFGDLMDPEFRSILVDFISLLTGKWWVRGWVYQEVLVARQIIVLHRRHCISWNEMVRAKRSLNQIMVCCETELCPGSESPAIFRVFFEEVVSLRPHIALALARAIGREAWITGGEMPITSLLRYSGFCKVTDERDRVYAFVGLANPGYKITPDYTADMAMVLRLTCKRIALYERSLNILRFSTLSFDSLFHRRRTDIPTWTSDWANPSGASSFVRQGLERLPSFQASLDHLVDTTFLPHGGVPDWVLRAQCLFVDNLSNPDSLSFSSVSDSIEVNDLRTWSQIAGGLKDSLPHSIDEMEAAGERYGAFLSTALRGSAHAWFMSESQNE
jgi:hypothetical protein